MLHVQRPPSMPSTLLSGYHPHHELHHLPQLRDFNWDWDKVGSKAGQAELLQRPPEYTSQRVGPSHPLKIHEITPPGTVVPSGQFMNPPGGPSTAPPYPTPTTHSRQGSNGKPFYQSYYSARQNQSPPTKKTNTVDRGEVIRRRASNDGNAIASYLQIPPSINDSKGSLPEFAAQITCLFWFESSHTLQLAQDPSSSNIIPAPLNADAMPSTGFRKWVTTILSMTQVTPNVIILALMFIYRLKSMNPAVKGKIGSEFRLLTVALMLGNKFLDDNTYTNKTWAEVSGISVQEIHVMEVEFLSNMRYSLFVQERQWDEWHERLGRFSTYYDRAAEEANRASTSILTRMPVLPSPPGSEQTSPPLPRTSPGNATVTHPQSIPPLFNPGMASPVSLPPPEFDPMKAWGRKRSLEDNQLDHPAKRLPSYIPPTTSNGPSMPSIPLRGSNSPIPRLPLPNIPPTVGQSNNLSAGQHGVQGHASNQLPVPVTRAMASVFPAPSRWPHNGMQLPSLPAAQHFGHAAGSGTDSPGTTLPNRPSPYGPASGTSSPTSYAFPLPQGGATSAGLSPSGMPLARTSPYKPVRGVHTLLVPPPSAAVFHAPQKVSYNQMRYQPLGQPKTETRTGVLPHFPFDTWSQSHQLQHYLPHPNFGS